MLKQKRVFLLVTVLLVAIIVGVVLGNNREISTNKDYEYNGEKILIVQNRIELTTLFGKYFGTAYGGSEVISVANDGSIEQVVQVYNKIYVQGAVIEGCIHMVSAADANTNTKEEYVLDLKSKSGGKREYKVTIDFLNLQLSQKAGGNVILPKCFWESGYAACELAFGENGAIYYCQEGKLCCYENGVEKVLVSDAAIKAHGSVFGGKKMLYLFFNQDRGATMYSYDFGSEHIQFCVNLEGNCYKAVPVEGGIYFVDDFTLKRYSRDQGIDAVVDDEILDILGDKTNGGFYALSDSVFYHFASDESVQSYDLPNTGNGWFLIPEVN